MLLKLDKYEISRKLAHFGANAMNRINLQFNAINCVAKNAIKLTQKVQEAPKNKTRNLLKSFLL